MNTKPFEIKKTICPLDCPDACGVLAKVQENEIKSLRGNPDHPFTRGFLCKKVSTYHERIHSRDRLLYPRKRTGAKGAGKFERISWDEAYTIMVEKLTAIKREFGGEALLPYSYAGNMGYLNRWAGYPFFHKYGASTLLHTICSTAAKAGWSEHYGPHPSSAPEKALDAELVIAWGINIKVTNVHFMPLVVEARRRGAKLLVIDPYKNSTARVADYYFPVNPGGDTALALGLLKSFHSRQELDDDFIKNHTDGFAELETYLSQTPLEDFITRSGLTPEQFERLRDLLSKHKRTFIRIGIGLSRNTQGAMSVRSLACLSAALGLFDGGKGRGALLMSGSFAGDSSVFTHPELIEKKTREINMVELGDALTTLTPPVKAIFVYSSNPLSVAPAGGLVRRGFAREDLFTIVHEQFMTPTARYADLLLPATTSFENQDVYQGYGHFYMGKVEPVIAPRGEAKSNFELFQTLARKMGYTDAAFEEKAAERIDKYISGLRGISEEDRERAKQAGEIIASDRIENGGNFSGFKGARFQFAAPGVPEGVSATPRLAPLKEFENPEDNSRRPFKLITPPNALLLNSTFGERYPETMGEVLIHPDDAADRNIKAGDKVKLLNDRGVHLRRASISDDTQKGLLVAEGIYWESAASEQSGVNDLTSQALTDLGGGGTFHESRVDIMRVD